MNADLRGGSGGHVRAPVERTGEMAIREWQKVERGDNVIDAGRQKRESLILLLALVIGAALLIYPSIADYWNSFHQSRAVRRYADQVANMNAEEYAGLIRNAEEYNSRLSDTGVLWRMEEEQKQEYESLLSINTNGVMGYIDIPKISVKLPIYHGTSEDVLMISIGHLAGTSLPVGGKGSHCALSGHRGLPSAKLFSDLDKLADGDRFTLSILNETYTYEVDRIRVVMPDDLSELEIFPGEDLCTLVTCTPYGVNTHRLLVRGHRVANENGDAQVVADAMQLEPSFVAPFLMIPMVVGLIFLLFFTPGGEDRVSDKRLGTRTGRIAGGSRFRR